MAEIKVNTRIPYVCRPFFALNKETQKDIEAYHEELCAKNEPPSSVKKQSILKCIVAVILGGGLLTGIVGFFKRSWLAIGTAVGLGLLGIGGGFYQASNGVKLAGGVLLDIAKNATGWVNEQLQHANENGLTQGVLGFLPGELREHAEP